VSPRAARCPENSSLRADADHSLKMIHHPRYSGPAGKFQPVTRPPKDSDFLPEESALFQELFWEIFRVLKFDAADEFAGGIAGRELT
jgi:hypothetical protein